MNIEQFRATKFAVARVSDVDGFDDSEGPGLLYLGSLVIEGDAKAGYSLLIENQYWDSLPLERLEEELFEYAKVAGFIEKPREGRLVSEYAIFQREAGVTLGSADEHFFDERLSVEQRAWLRSFSERWQEAVR